jgi:hypothetical protein
LDADTIARYEHFEIGHLFVESDDPVKRHAIVILDGEAQFTAGPALSREWFCFRLTGYCSGD